MNNISSINTRNYSQKTNFMCGASTLELLPFYVTTLTIPGINVVIPEISGRAGAPVFMAAANINFNPLSLEVLLDENYQIYKDLIKCIKVDVETGTFENTFFDFWTVVTNYMGVPVMKIEYYNCNIEVISDLSLAVNDDITEQVFSVDIRFDYFKIVENPVLPTLEV